MHFHETLILEHDLWLVALATVVCAVGAWVTVRLQARSRKTSGAARLSWLFLGAVSAGTGVWCAHHIALLAYHPPGGMSYDPVLTAASLAAAIVISGIGLHLSSALQRFPAEIGGTVFGLAIAAAHYLGMASIVTTSEMHVNPLLVGLSVVIGIGFSILTFRYGGDSRYRWFRARAGLCSIFAVLLLHLVGMVGWHVDPTGAAFPEAVTDEARHVLAIVVAGVGLLVLGSGLAGLVLYDLGREAARRRMRSMVEGASDGMMIVCEGRIMVINNLAAQLLGGGIEKFTGCRLTKVLDVPDSVTKQGMFIRELQNSDGETVPVEIQVRAGLSANGDTGVTVYTITDMRPRLSQEKRMDRLTNTDPLTRLPNRRAFLKRMSEVAGELDGGERVALLLADISRFNHLNDTYGHRMADRVLREVANRLRSELPDDAIISRLHGDEFAALVPVNGAEQALDLARHLDEAMREPYCHSGVTVSFSAGFGASVFPDDARTVSELLTNADIALKRSKASKDENVSLYEAETGEVIRHQRRIVRGLRQAIQAQEFQLHYQPQFDFKTGAVTGYEALLRWDSPELGPVSPAEFIPLAEQSGLISEIGEWVLWTACSEAASWNNDCTVAVNLSSFQLGEDGELAGLVHEVLLSTGLSPARLEIEITESAVVDDPDRAVQVLRLLKTLGVSIAIDDFGTGYSSLSTLRAFPFDKIKLDRSFLRDLEKSEQTRAVLRAVLALGQSLSMSVLCEGVETSAELDFLRDEGFTAAQGYFIGRPARELIGQKPVPVRMSA